MYQHMHNAYKHDKIVDKHMFLCGVKGEHIRVYGHTVGQSKLKIIFVEYYKKHYDYTVHMKKMECWVLVLLS